MWWLNSDPPPVQGHNGRAIRQPASPESRQQAAPPVRQPNPLVVQHHEWSADESRQLRSQLLKYELAAKQSELAAKQSELAAKQSAGELAQLQTRYAELETRHAAQLAAADQAAQHNLADVQRQHATKIEQLRAQSESDAQRAATSEAQCLTLQTQLEKIESQRAAQKAESDRVAIENQSKVQQLQEQLGLASQVSRDRHSTIRRLQSQLDRRQADHVKKQTRLCQFMDERIAHVEQQHASELEQLRETLLSTEQSNADQAGELCEYRIALSDRETELSEQNRSHAGELADLRHRHSIETQRLVTALKLSEVKVAQQDALWQQMAGYDAQIEHLRDALDKANCVLSDRDDLVLRIDKYDAQIEHLRIALDAADRDLCQRDVLILELQEKLDREAIEHNRRFEFLHQHTKTHFDDAERRHVDELADLQRQHSDEKAALHDAMIRRLEACEEEIDNLRTAVDSADRDLYQRDDVVRELQADLLRQANDHALHCKDLQQLTDTCLADAEERNSQAIAELIHEKEDLTAQLARRQTEHAIRCDELQAQCDRRLTNWEVKHQQASEQWAACQNELKESLATALSENRQLKSIVDHLHRKQDEQKTLITDNIRARIAAEACLWHREQAHGEVSEKYRTQIASLESSLRENVASHQAEQSAANDRQEEHVRLLAATEQSLESLEHRLSLVECSAEQKAAALTSMQRDNAMLHEQCTLLTRKHAEEISTLNKALETSRQRCDVVQAESLRVAVITNRCQSSLREAEAKNKQLLVAQTQLRDTLQQRLTSEMQLRNSLESQLRQAVDSLAIVETDLGQSRAENDQLIRENERLSESRQQLVFQNRVLVSGQHDDHATKQLEAALQANAELEKQRAVEIAALRNEIARISCVAVSQKQQLTQLQTHVSTLTTSGQGQLSTSEIEKSAAAMWQGKVARVEQDAEALRKRVCQEAAARRKAEAALRLAIDDESRSTALQVWSDIETDERIQRLTRRLKAVETMRDIERRHAVDQIQLYRNKIRALKSQTNRRNVA